MRLTPEQVKPELVDIDQLRPHPDNPRNGDQEFINNSVATHGVFRTIVVSSDDVVLAGNHTYAGALEEGETQLWISRVPFEHTSEQARQIMLVDNRGADLGRYDTAQLVKVLQDLEDTVPAGYGEDDVAELVAQLNRENHAPIGGEQPASLDLTVTCKSQREKKALARRLSDEGFTVEG